MREQEAAAEEAEALMAAAKSKEKKRLAATAALKEAKAEAGKPSATQEDKDALSQASATLRDIDAVPSAVPVFSNDDAGLPGVDDGPEVDPVMLDLTVQAVDPLSDAEISKRLAGKNVTLFEMSFQAAANFMENNKLFKNQCALGIIDAPYSPMKAWEMSERVALRQAADYMMAPGGKLIIFDSWQNIGSWASVFQGLRAGGMASTKTKYSVSKVSRFFVKTKKSIYHRDDHNATMTSDGEQAIVVTKMVYRLIKNNKKGYCTPAEDKLLNVKECKSRFGALQVPMTRSYTMSHAPEHLIHTHTPHLTHAATNDLNPAPVCVRRADAHGVQTLCRLSSIQSRSDCTGH